MSKSLAIVGHEAAKFTRDTEQIARIHIRDLFRVHNPDVVESGECPLGGIDIWTRLEAVDAGIRFVPRAPRQHSWEGEYGFKARNLDLSKCSHVACVVVETLPATYTGMRFNGCYHCGTRNQPHVKSGGCWTAWRCPSREWRYV